MLSSFFIPLLFIFFSFDIWLFFLFHIPPFITLSLWYAALFSERPSPSLTIFPLFLYMSLSQTMGLAYWWPLVIVAPWALAIIHSKSYVFGSPFYPATLAALCMATDVLALRPLLLGRHIAPSYTMGVIFATLFLTTIFSLKIKASRAGQSLTHG